MISTTALRELCTFVNGGTPSRAVKSYWEGPHPWITSTDLDDADDIVNDARYHISEQAIEESATNRVRAGDILLVSRTGVGKVAIAGRDIFISQDFTGISPDPEQLNSRYLLRFLRSKRRYLESVARGATIKGITRDVIADLTIPLPGLGEQKRIAALLDKADTIRRKRREALNLADEFLHSSFLEMFGDPVTNPKEWPMDKLGQLGTLDRGKSRHRPRDEPSLYGGLHPFIQTGDVANCNGVIRRYTQTYSDFGLRQSRKWPAGTLTITIAANIGKTGILGFDACFPDSVVGFTPKPPVTAEFIQFWLNQIQGRLEEAAPQSAQKNINLEILRDLDVPVPDEHQLVKFTQLVQSTRKIKLRQEALLLESDALFGSVQQRAFNGHPTTE